MIKIIKPGKFIHEVTCDICGCVFSFEAEDVTRTINYDNHGCSCSDWFDINCPCCSGEFIMVESDFREFEIKQMKVK